jgi:hypothetical protein
MNGNNDNPKDVTTGRSIRWRASWPLIVLAALFIVVPFLTWYGTWFGRKLSDEEIAGYLNDEKNTRHIQHALSRIEERIEMGDPTVKKFYPQVIALTKSPVGEIRKTAAWVMGQDNTAEEFHGALVGLLNDGEPLVRRNAALQLVRFGDGAGRSELHAMLQPFEAKSPIAGSVASLLTEGSEVRAGALLARIRDISGSVQEFRSPVDGTINKLAVKEGQAVTEGQTIVWLIPDRATLSDALRALAYVGTKDDLPLILTFAQASGTKDDEIKQLAVSTTKAIEGRAGLK